jgi:hypothetical protein
MVFPISPNIFERLVKVSISPPTIIERVPPIAHISPPDTGASRLEIHFSFAVLNIFSASEGFVVVISTNILPSLAFSIIPFSQKYVFSTFVGSQIIVMIISELADNSAMLSTYVAQRAIRLSVFD